MSYEATESTKYKQASPGTHTGICYLVADIGTQEVTFEGETSKKHQVIIGWELPEELTDDGSKRLSVIKTYTSSFHEKATLYKDLIAWLGKTAKDTVNFNDVLGLVGKGCNLAIGQTSGGNAKVIGVSALKKSEKTPPLSVDTVVFDLRKPDDMAMAKLPNFIKDKIAASPEYQRYVSGATGAADPKNDLELSDTIPF